MPGRPVAISLSAVQQAQLRELYASRSPERYIEFIAGSWLLSNSGGGNEQELTGTLVQFLPQTKTVVIYSPEAGVQEIYRWNRIDFFYRDLKLRSTVNSVLPDIHKDITVTIDAPGRIRLSVASSIDRTDRWSARYTRMSEQALASFFRQRGRETGDQEEAAGAQPSFRLEGLYQSSDGEEIIFESPRFTWIGKQRVDSGGFYLYTLNVPVLGLLVVHPDGGRPEEKTYILDYSSQRRENRVVRSITLQQATLSILGATPVEGEPLHFSQTEILEKEESQDAGPSAVSR